MEFGKLENWRKNCQKVISKQEITTNFYCVNCVKKKKFVRDVKLIMPISLGEEIVSKSSVSLTNHEISFVMMSLHTIIGHLKSVPEIYD